MKRTVRTLTLALVAGLLASSSLFAQFNTTGTTTLSVTVAPEGAISVAGATPLTTSTTIFDPYTGSTSFTYKIRTTTSNSTITLSATEFAGTGPKLANSNLTYTCAATAPAVPCSGTQTAATTATAVATFGANAHSLTAGTAGNTISWVLANDPAYTTGAYTSTVTFTIAAL